MFWRLYKLASVVHTPLPLGLNSDAQYKGLQVETEAQRAGASWGGPGTRSEALLFALVSLEMDQDWRR